MHLDSHRQLEFYWGLADPSRQLEEPRNMKVIAGFKCYIAVTSPFFVMVSTDLLVTVIY